MLARPSSAAPTGRSRSSALVFATATLLATSACRRPATTDDITVAAAADLSLAFREIGEAFEKQGHRKPTFTFGSTGLLAKQIAEGAPYDVFAAANVSFVDDVVRKKSCDGASKSVYGRGRIVIFTRKGAAGNPPKSLADLGQSKYARIAIANPEHAPYGRAAQEALTSEGVWADVKPKLVYGENVQQALQFAQTGNADAAIVALSLAIFSEGTFVPVDADRHRPIEQALVVCGSGPRAEAGRAFTAFVSSTAGRAIMKRYGFLLPGEVITREVAE